MAAIFSGGEWFNADSNEAGYNYAKCSILSLQSWKLGYTWQI